MGRYANFNTGFEYKFSFGSQSSYDIQKFGGRIIINKDDDGYMIHQWTQKDKNNLNFEALVLEIDFDKYEKNLNGTQKLRSDLRDLNLDSTDIL
jgi:hypothetical protein